MLKYPLNDPFRHVAINQSSHIWDMNFLKALAYMTKVKHMMAISLQLPTILSSYVDLNREALILKNTTRGGIYGYLHMNNKYCNQVLIHVY